MGNDFLKADITYFNYLMPFVTVNLGIFGGGGGGGGGVAQLTIL